MKDKMTIPRSFLMSGKDLKISNSLSVKHPTVQEVIDIDKENDGLFSEKIYYNWVSVFICDPYNYMVYLDDKKLDYEKIDSFDLFILLYKDTLKRIEDIKTITSKQEYDKIMSSNPYYQAFNFFLDKKYFKLAKDETGSDVIADCSTNTILIDRDIFYYISEFIKSINGIIEDTSRINPDDEFAKKILIEDERTKLKKQKKDLDNKEENNRLGNLLSAITWGTAGGITPFNRSQLHMYDLVDGVSRTDKLLNFNHTMTGIYSGCVDKDKINMQKINWQS